VSTARVKNWAEFQHYKDRSPPWIKLHRALLDDFKFSSLPLASKALAPLLWLLAAETANGEVSVDVEFLAFRLRWNAKDVKAGLDPLIHRGFLVLASAPLATCLQPATPEREGETEKEKALGDKSPSAFEVWWKGYPNKKGKQEAEKSWNRQKLDAKLATLLADVAARRKGDADWLRGAIPHGSTYLNQARWLDALAPDALPPASEATNPGGTSPAKQETAEDRAAAAKAHAEYVAQFGYGP
jgi:hypothetical protein